MNAQDVDLEKLLKRLHLPTVARLYPSYCPVPRRPVDIDRADKPPGHHP